MENIGIKLHFTNGEVLYLTRDMMTKKSDTVYTAFMWKINITWTLTPCENGFFSLVEAESERPLKINRIDSAVIPVGKVGSRRFSMFTNDMYTGETRYADEVGVDREYCGDGIALCDDFVSPALIVAGVSPFKNKFGAGQVTHLCGDTELFAKTEYTLAQSNEKSLSTERVIVLDGVTHEQFYDRYRALLPKSSFDMPKLTGWNTWDYYLQNIFPEDIAENVDALAKLPFADKLDYVVIDDGWQKEWGVWTENEKFACGIRSVADKIKSAGFTAGIWMAPLGAHKNETLVNEHPDWFCYNEDGTLYESMGLIYLDPTHPDAERFILDNYRYQYNAGYRLFKIDYLSPLVSVRVFHDPAATGYSALRKLMKRIVEATGEDVVILGCSLPVQCGADIAPAMRIGVDIHNYWSHVKWIAQSLKYTWMYNGTVTRIDPDFIVVRGEETSAVPIAKKGNFFKLPPRSIASDSEIFKAGWFNGNEFSATEAATWANLLAVIGGNLILSDRIAHLNELGVQILADAFDIAAECGRPRHLKDDRRLPSVWESERSLVVINWEDEERTLTVPDVKRELISKSAFSLENGTLTVTLKPHESFAALYK